MSLKGSQTVAKVSIVYRDKGIVELATIAIEGDEDFYKPRSRRPGNARTGRDLPQFFCLKRLTPPKGLAVSVEARLSKRCLGLWQLASVRARNQVLGVPGVPGQKATKVRCREFPGGGHDDGKQRSDMSQIDQRHGTVWAVPAVKFATVRFPPTRRTHAPVTKHLWSI